ncbi:hypothetical protein CFP56_022229 [Quercus suber]|uniref:Uncharacterized protein n=1 Tax=Quercus suber TaxID=58331 RepID=A0AAW0KBK5_QUESU
MEPSLSNDYFGNSLHALREVTTAGELLEHNLGWAALKLHEAVANHTDQVVRDWVGVGVVIRGYHGDVAAYIV